MPTSSNYHIVYIGSSHFQKTLHAILTPVIMKLMIIKTDFEQKLKKKYLVKGRQILLHVLQQWFTRSLKIMRVLIEY